MTEPTLIDRLRHHAKHPVVGAITDKYLHELFGRSADLIVELQAESSKHYDFWQRQKIQNQELEAKRKADCIAFAQWFRSGNNRDGRTEDECWRVWTALGDEE